LRSIAQHYFSLGITNPIGRFGFGSGGAINSRMAARI